MLLESWLKFSKNQQIGAIAAEIKRSKIWQGKDKENFLSAIERLIDLIDLTIDDKRWQRQLSILFWLRDKITKIYLGLENANLELEILQRAL